MVSRASFGWAGRTVSPARAFWPPERHDLEEAALHSAVLRWLLGHGGGATFENLRLVFVQSAQRGLVGGQVTSTSASIGQNQLGKSVMPRRSETIHLPNRANNGLGGVTLNRWKTSFISRVPSATFYAHRAFSKTI
jgi:hypothetical protein